MFKSFALLAAAVQASYHELQDGYSVKLYVDESNSAIIHVEMKPDSWLGLGLGTDGMREGADMLQIDANMMTCTDETSQGHK